MKKLLLTLVLAFCFSANAQVKIGDNPTTIGASSLMELESTSKALVITRVQTVAAITTPVNGMIVYEIANNCFKGYYNGKWSGCGLTEAVVASSGGTAVVSSFGAPSCTANAISGTMKEGTPVTGVNMTIYANVTTLGTYNITAGPTNGVTFTGSGTFTALGCQPLVLQGNGIPTAGGSNTFTTNTTPAATASGTTAFATSSGGSAIVSAWACDTAGAGQMYAGIAVSDVTHTVTATVANVGSYNISVTANGITFAGAGTFSGTGAQAVVLTASGTPTASGTFNYPLPTSPTCSFTRQAMSNAPLGGSYTTFYNGVVSGNYTGTATTVTHSTGETFNSFTATGCNSKPISAGGCGGLTTVTGASGTVYNLVNINGQCWFKENLKEIPSAYSSYSSNSWLATSPSDLGYWGYYNTTDTSGASGWGVSEPTAGEGLKYQWSAAMNSPNNYDNERSKGICPTGFHIPSDCEWFFFEHGLGMKMSENYAPSGTWRDNVESGGGKVGYKLRSQGTGSNNASGFTSKLSGYRIGDGTFRDRAALDAWWTSASASASTAFDRVVATGFAGVNRAATNKTLSFSVRCLKD